MGGSTPHLTSGLVLSSEASTINNPAIFPFCSIFYEQVKDVFLYHLTVTCQKSCLLMSSLMQFNSWSIILSISVLGLFHNNKMCLWNCASGKDKVPWNKHDLWPLLVTLTHYWHWLSVYAQSVTVINEKRWKRWISKCIGLIMVHVP